MLHTKLILTLGEDITDNLGIPVRPGRGDNCDGVIPARLALNRINQSEVLGMGPSFDGVCPSQFARTCLAMRPGRT